MLDHSESYRQELKRAWEHFIAYEDYDYSAIRPEIFDSWRRSRDHNVNPNEIKSIIYSEDHIKNNIKEHEDLIKTVRPYMEQIYSIVRDSGFYILLCDNKGIILDLLGDETIIQEAKKCSNLIIGANRSEEFAGTNAIGTCLALNSPIQIWSEEHYMKPHKSYTCSAGPIYSSDGKLLGCLNLTGKDSEVHTHTLGMVLCAVDGISKELQIKNAYMDIENINIQKNIILDSVDSGFMILDEDNNVIQISELSKKMLNLEFDITGRDFFEYFTIDDDTHVSSKFSEMTYPVISKEHNYYAKNTYLPPKKLVTTVKFHMDNDKRYIVIKLDETSRINKITSKVSGFKAHFTFDHIIGNSKNMTDMINLSKRSAKSNSNILILGESGTGKEMVAQAIHNESSYASGPFVAINCAALPNGLIESELFGYEGGAFTGARKDGNPGKFELADGGTIFLDEIGDMPLDVQASLLRVIQTKEVVRIGSKYSKKIDVRIIAATNSDLSKAVEQRTFREDLYYRLNVITINMPPLRNRDRDVCRLSDYLLANNAKALGNNMSFASDIYDVFMAYDWPGNVRELENVVERAVHLASGSVIEIDDLHPSMIDGIANKSDKKYKEGDTGMQDIEKNRLSFQANGYKMILESLQQTGGNVKRAAELLGISRRTLYRKMEKYNIDYSKYR